ncbi:MAG: hypothetical protein IPL54_00230 [Chitinophagaceae bacterium]|nr:hypothetical protein [Chitinophagaceae bacterium]
MMTTSASISELFAIRNQYGEGKVLEKLQLLRSINIKNIKSNKAAQTLYTTLLFLQAYPDNKTIHKQAEDTLQLLTAHITANENLTYKLYNTGITGTTLCAAFGFEMVKWLRKTHAASVRFNSFQHDEAYIQPFVSVIMNKAESEIFQDGNASWKEWLKRVNPDEDILDQLIAIFDSSDIRPEVKDEIWNAIGINIEIDFITHCRLPVSLTINFYHRALIREQINNEPFHIPVTVSLTPAAAEQIIDCSRMILMRHLREIDPISFTAANLISYYHLPRGISIALMGMVPERRHPIDSYMGYMVFKNGLPVAYAGSWILFNSGRIGLNVFPGYRGGETRFIFEQVLQLHAGVYHLKRFTADPYQIGKDNSDGIRSGAFWVYYHAGFRPLEKKQQQVAATEAANISMNKKYRSAPAVLKELANSRLEMVLQKTAVRFDATDLSRTYAGILTKKYQGNRLLSEQGAVKKLAAILKIKNCQDQNMHFVLKSWCIFLLCNEKEILQNNQLKKTLKILFNQKATGSEEAYIATLQKSHDLRRMLEELVKMYAIDLKH